MVLEERKQALVGLISRQQDDKLKHTQTLLCQLNARLEAAVTLVELAIRSMEETNEASFIQVRNTTSCSTPGLFKMAATVNQRKIRLIEVTQITERNVFFSLHQSSEIILEK